MIGGVAVVGGGSGVDDSVGIDWVVVTMYVGGKAGVGGVRCGCVEVVVRVAVALSVCNNVNNNNSIKTN